MGSRLCVGLRLLVSVVLTVVVSWLDVVVVVVSVEVCGSGEASCCRCCFVVTSGVVVCLQCISRVGGKSLRVQEGRAVVVMLVSVGLVRCVVVGVGFLEGVFAVGRVEWASFV